MKFGPIFKQGKRPNWVLLTAILLLHLAALYGLARALAPDFTRTIEQQVFSTFVVSVSVGEQPEAPPDPDEGAQGDPGERAVARAETAPDRPIETKPAPRASSTGTANRSGANDSGEGTGAAGQGEGTGSGQGGSGSGNGQTPDLSRRPSIASGTISDARDFPVPEGGRSARFGTLVEVIFTVTPDGRATNCSVARSTADAQTTALVCGLVQQKIRFNPALNRDGEPIAARYGYRQTFSPR